MADADLLMTLCDEVYPALASDMALEDFLLAVCSQMAEARGLDPLVGAVPDALAALDFTGADLTLPGALYTALMAGRHGKGAYYTPPALAAQVATWTLDGVGGASRPTVFDPAMGSGGFLIAAGEVLASRIRAERPDIPPAEARWAACERLYGVDSDPAAVRLGAISLWLWAGLLGTRPETLQPRLLCGDALLDEGVRAALPDAFDVVVGNPPYASVFTRARGEDAALKAAIQGRYETAQGSFDLAVPFVELSVKALREGGRCGLVLPNKILAAHYARRLRAWLGAHTAVEVIADYAGAMPFDAGVYPVALVVRRCAPLAGSALTLCRCGADDASPEVVRDACQDDLRQVPGGLWSALLAPDWETLSRCFEGSVPLGERAELHGGLTVGEAYALRDRVVDMPVGFLPDGAVRLITTGLIDRYAARWGKKDARYLKRCFHRPVLMGHALPPRRQMQARQHKIIVAGLGLRPRAFVDPGLAQASVSTTVIMGSAWPLDALCAVLNSDVAARLYRALYGGLALSGDYLRFGKRELGAFPLPDLAPDDVRVRRLAALSAERVRADHITQVALDADIDALVAEMYGL